MIFRLKHLTVIFAVTALLTIMSIQTEADNSVYTDANGDTFNYTDTGSEIHVELDKDNGDGNVTVPQSINGKNVTYFVCNRSISFLDASDNMYIRNIRCAGCGLEEINLHGCLELDTLSCSKNRLTTLDVSSCSELHSLNCSENKLTSLTLGFSHRRLTYLSCNRNEIKELDVSNYRELTELSCSYNNITELV